MKPPAGPAASAAAIPSPVATAGLVELRCTTTPPAGATEASVSTKFCVDPVPEKVKLGGVKPDADTIVTILLSPVRPDADAVSVAVPKSTTMTGVCPARP